MKIDNQDIYDKNWDEWLDMKRYGPASRWLRALIADISKTIPLHSVQRILDVGCGEGTNTAFLADIFSCSHVTGVNFSKTGIDNARRCYHSDRLTFLWDSEGKSLDNRYDLITCFEVLEHIDNWQEFLYKISKASDCYLMLSFPTGRKRAFESNVGHVRNFKKGEVERYLCKIGFDPLTVFYAGFPFYSPLYRELCNMTNMG